jgi:glycosyltransferase involved in cell wall biosynthesis
MTVMFLITRGDSIGGAQIHVKDMAKQLLKDGHNVSVSFGKEGVFAKLLKENAIEYRIIENMVREINPLQDILALKNIIAEIRRIKPDLIAIHSSKAGILGRIAAKITGTPAVFTAHGWAFSEGIDNKKRIIYRWIEKAGALISDRIITVSKYDRHLSLSNNIGTAEKITAIQNGVYDIKDDLHASVELDPPNIIMVARFQAPKDHIGLIHALYELKHLKWHLQLVGEDGGLMEKTKHLVSDLGLEEKVDFLGNRSDITTLLSQSQIFVLTSSWEGFPLTVIEAMRAGLPVIASNVGGVSEAVIDEKTGYVITTHAELVSRLKQLILSPELRVKMGKKGLKRYKENFTFNEMYNKTLAVYTKIVTSHS